MGHKVVYNACYGGFGLSKEAVIWLETHGSKETKDMIKEIRDKEEESIGCAIKSKLSRHNKDLVSCIETLGDKASGDFSKLRVCNIEGSAYRIEEYDGFETIIDKDDDNFFIKFD